MLPRKSQPDFGWLFALYLRENGVLVNQRNPTISWLIVGCWDEVPLIARTMGREYVLPDRKTCR